MSEQKTCAECNSKAMTGYYNDDKEVFVHVCLDCHHTEEEVPVEPEPAPAEPGKSFLGLLIDFLQ